MAGVSTATVSRVINQTAWVEPVTRERVEKAMRDLNYRRNAAAIALAKRSGDMLGLLTGNLADPFFARLARGVEDVSRKQQYRLMVCSGGHDEEMEKAGLDFLVKLAGLGVLHGLRPSLAPFIASGELTEILTDFPPPPKPVSLLYPDRRYLAPKVRVFIDWLCEVFGPDAHL